MRTHYDEEALFGYLDRSAETEEIAGIETHLAACSDCRALFASLQEFFSALASTEVWSLEEPGVPEAPIHAAKIDDAVEAARFLSRGAAESDRIVSKIVEHPVGTWRMRCAAAPELRIPAAVQNLLRRSQEAREKNPTEALELARMAIDLSSTFGASDAETRLKGLAWKEASNAYRYLSRYDEALDAIDRAASFFRKMLVSEYDLCAVEYCRGQVMRELGRLREALAHARRSRDLALQFGDTRRVALAAILEGNSHASAGDWAAARDAYMSVIKPMQEAGDAPMVAALLHNVGACCKELGDLDAAGTYYLQAVLTYEALGMIVEMSRVRWNLGQMLLATGKFDEAIDRLNQCRAEFDRLDMRTEVGLISLDLAEALLALGRATEIPPLCRETIRIFESVGVSQPAKIALAYLDEAVRTEKATPKVVRYVREYLEELPKRENLLFAPPLE